MIFKHDPGCRKYVRKPDSPIKSPKSPAKPASPPASDQLQDYLEGYKYPAGGNHSPKKATDHS